jgi:7-carboxy-7-deazaguanine synthase
MSKLLINTIYRATEGEGVHVGSPQVFVRFQGCAIGCVNCDSKETWDFTPQSAMELEAVVAKIQALSLEGRWPLNRVSITGGDPLHPQHVPGLMELMIELKLLGFWINLEAAGSRIVDEVFKAADFISFDFKTPSTGVRTSLEVLARFIREYGHKGQIKAVIADNADFGAAFEARRQIEEKVGPHPIPWVLTPCYNPGEKAPIKRFQEVSKLNEDWGAPFRVIGQQHKWMYGPDAKNV